MQKTGVLVINLGSPADCTPSAVYHYLSEFLNDPRVIDIPAILRKLLVNAIIVPFRYRRSARAYAQVWLPTGSPLLHHTKNFGTALAAALDNSYQVQIAMRYGNPSIRSALNALQHCDKLWVLPLFPQYSSAATGSAIQKLMVELQTTWNIPALYLSNYFYNFPGFIDAYANLISKHLTEKKIDSLLFSYHGLPERHIKKSKCRATCDHLHDCPAMQSDNDYCYRAQCFATTKLIATQLNLPRDAYEICFQSRLGRTPWIKPYTDLLLPKLIQKGKKNIAMVCPSFVADCLETLEEVNIRTRAQWKTLGGENFYFIPCLNDDAIWVDAVAGWIKEKQI